MTSGSALGLPEALERAARALAVHADAIRPANGDPVALLGELPGDAAIEVLTWLLGNEPEAGAELAIAWADEGERGAQAVLGVAGDRLPKPGRKGLRRAQHRLRSRGIGAIDPGPVQLVAMLPKVDDSIECARLSGIDPGGARAVYLVESNPGGGARLFAVVFDDARGILECEVFETTRSNARRFLRDVTQSRQFPTVDVAPAAARALVNRAAAAQSPDRALPRAFSEWRSRVADAEDGAPLPGALAREALAAGIDAGALDLAVRRVREGKLGPWPPAEEKLQSLADEIGKLGEGRIIVSGAQRRERLDTILNEALRASYGGEFSALTAHRFEETAFLLWKGGDPEGAGACLAAADAFRDSPPTENPVARAMLEVVLAPILTKVEKDASAKEQESLLIDP